MNIIYTERNYKCEIKDNNIGFLCGYVLIPLNHPKYNDEFESTIFVHGGVTWSHEQEDGVIIGFDCGHWGDLPDPEYVKIHPEYAIFGSDRSHDTFKDEYFVRKEISRMIDQLENDETPEPELNLPL